MEISLRGETPEEKAGQHIMGGFDGVEAPASLLERIRAGRLGGIILFSRNVESAAQVLRLTRSLQGAAAESRFRLPLLIAIDQEGGRVSRLSEDFTLFPSAETFGRIGDPELARRAARVSGAELRAVGGNMNMAPVLDLLTNPECSVIGDRSFGADPRRVGEMARAVAAGLQAEGVAAVAKHFPGIGDLAPDPHVTMPYSEIPPETLRERELLPYGAVFGAHLPGGGLAGVMAVHAVYRKMDSERPASLSPYFLQDLLREELGFGGLAVTDDLEMGAIPEPAEAARDALRAGADIALVCHEEAAQERALERIAESLRGGEGAQEEESLRRICTAKARFCPPAEAFPEKSALGGYQNEKIKIVGCPAHRKIREEVLRRREERPTR